MNFSIILYILGWVIRLQGVFMLLPCIVGLLYGEMKNALIYFAAGLCCILASVLFRRPKSSRNAFYAKEGFVAVSLSWIIMSILGAIPFVLSGDIPSFTDALFEIISGYTTTGSSILTNVEALSYSNLFFRSFSHWIGGMGVLVFILAILPMAGGSTMNLMKAESPGPSVGKLVPRVQQTAFLLYAIYMAMTAIEIVLLLFGGLPLFDALCLSFGTAGTGGFSILSDSIAGYSVYVQIVITIFMFLFGVNFTFFYYLLIRRFKDALHMEEVRCYLGIYLLSVLLITWNLVSHGAVFGKSLLDAAFQVSSIMTTTGYATTDFNLWPEFSRFLLVCLMFGGACAGSTAGSMKISRIMIYAKQVKKELMQQVYPRRIHVIKMDKKPVEHSVLHSANVLLMAYVLVLVVSILLISFDGFDTTTNFTAVMATLNNIGLGLNGVGPSGSFSGFSMLSKYVLMFDMLAGRLELMPMLLLFSPSTWKK